MLSIGAKESNQKTMSAKRKRSRALEGLQLSKARLDELVEEALVDAYGDSEQATAFYTMLENDLALPFETQILGSKASTSPKMTSLWQFAGR
jgi:hypothetical protein